MSFQKVGGLVSRLPVMVLIRAWKEAAGPVLLKHSEFMGVFEIEGGDFELRLKVVDPIWRQELEFQKEEILKTYNRMLERMGYPADRRPTRCLLSHTPPLPFQSLHAKNRGNKGRIK